MNYIQLNFHKWSPQTAKYENGRLAIRYVSFGAGYEEQEIIATINLPHEFIAADEVIIKDYAEGEGLCELMIGAGHISEPIRFVQTGWVTVPICKIKLDESYETKA